MGDIQIQVPMPLDENGMLGRECLECKQYFNYAFNQIIKPSLDKLSKSFKDLERSTRNSLIQIKVTTPTIHNNFPIKYYSEEELETNLTCDNCGLVFSVYGVFARCPDCSETNAFLIYDKSIEATEKQLGVILKPEVPVEIQDQFISLVLSSCVSAFDGLGKELRRKRPELYPEKPKNLFQNISALDDHLDKIISKQLADYDQLFKMFQVRHIIEHNMGVVDEDFIKKIPTYQDMLRRKYPLTSDEVNRFLSQMKKLGQIIRNHFKK